MDPQRPTLRGGGGEQTYSESLQATFNDKLAYEVTHFTLQTVRNLGPRDGQIKRIQSLDTALGFVFMYFVCTLGIELRCVCRPQPAGSGQADPLWVRLTRCPTPGSAATVSDQSASDVSVTSAMTTCALIVNGRRGLTVSVQCAGEAVSCHGRCARVRRVCQRMNVTP